MGFSSQECNETVNPEVVESSEMEAAESVIEETETEALIRQLAQKTQEAQEIHDRWLRLAAEMENFKRRQEKERADLRQFANESLIKELLPIVDNLELAINHGRQQEPGSALQEGVENVLKGFLAALTKFGVTPIQALGDKFDPTFHNAVMQQEDDSVEDQTIIQDLQKGYLLHNRLLRPAMVVVARHSQS